ncbi:MAG: Aldehyde dehydrogenase, thermostable [Spirochaetes bacterium ADurb.Bin110]|nr:MAG: Aldehyde dehydrogenase, thermostable [Spirochaetes bacterium ADurb.Bin110]
MAEPQKFENFINGQWKEPQGGNYYPDINPADYSDIVGCFPLSTKNDVDEAIQAAHIAFKSWSHMLPAERAKYLEKFALLLDQEKQRIGEALCREEGKTLKEAIGEPSRAVVETSFFIGEGQRLEGITMPSDRKGVVSVATRVPIGVVAAISPWNFPLLTPLRKIIPALVFGNTVVFKPASDTPYCAVLLMQLFEKAGLPSGVVNLVIGKGSAIGDAISSNPLVKGITFTGSTVVGRRINQLASEHFAKVQLEMGGKNPAIVADYKDLNRAAAEIASAAYAVSGQRCTAVSRVIVLKEHAEELETKIIEKAKGYVIGNGMRPDVTMGPIITKEAGEKIMEYIHGAEKEGATIKYGGHHLSGGEFDKGFYIEPTLITDVTPSMRVAREEIFGPVLVSIKVDTFEEAIEVANNTEYGLASCLFSDNLKYIYEFQQEVESGMTHVNHGTVTDASMPFGGAKNSGLGPFSKGATNKDFYTNYKVNYVKYI